MTFSNDHFFSLGKYFNYFKAIILLVDRYIVKFLRLSDRLLSIFKVYIKRNWHAIEFDKSVYCFSLFRYTYNWLIEDAVCHLVESLTIHF